MTWKKSISTFFKGILLGLISVGVPGLSASTVGIVIGIYFLMVESISGIFSDLKNNGLFLLSLIAGYCVGAVGAAFSVTLLFERFALPTTLAVLGFVLGSLPDMIYTVRKDVKKISCWLTFAAVIAVLVLYNVLLGKKTQTTFPDSPSPLYLLGMGIVGLFTSATFIVPGVDFAVVFLSIGLYYPFMNLITELLSFSAAVYEATLVKNLEIIGCYLVGYFVGMFLFSKLVKFLSKRYTAQTDFASLAFVAFAPVAVIRNCIFENPSFESTPTGWAVGSILALAAFGAMVWFNLVQRRRREGKETGLKRITRIVLKNFIFVPHLIFRCKRIAKKDTMPMADRFRLAVGYIRRLHRSGGVDIAVYGKENLSADLPPCVYVSNHQSGDDPLVILSNVEPNWTSFVVDAKWKKTPLYREVSRMMKAVYIDKKNLKSQVATYKTMEEEIKKGTSYLLFPEGGYADNGNELQTFHGACFYPIVRTGCPIVPVCLYDTHKVFPSRSKRITVEVHFLPPIYKEEYEGLSRDELAQTVKGRIQARLDEINARKAAEEEKIAESVGSVEGATAAQESKE